MNWTLCNHEPTYIFLLQVVLLGILVTAMQSDEHSIDYIEQGASFWDSSGLNEIN
jgi:hypothetical protein